MNSSILQTCCKKMQECPICYQDFPEKKMIKLAPCRHEYCNECITKSCTHNGPKCPLCREIICAILPIHNPQISDKTNKKSNHLTIITELKDDKRAGVTLYNKSVGEENKVLVSKLKKGDVFSKCLHINDCIESINGIPLRCHKESIDIIENITCKFHTTVIHISRTKKESLWKKWKSQAFKLQ